AAVVRRLMAKHPDDRYRAPAELAEALGKLSTTGVLPREYQPASLIPAGHFRGAPGSCVGAAFTRDGQTLVAGANRVLVLRDIADGREVGRYGEASQAITALAATADLVLAGRGAGVRIHASSSGQEIGKLVGHTGAVRCVSLSGDGARAVTGGDD